MPITITLPMYKSKFETKNVGNSIVIPIGEKNASQYKRVKDNETNTPVEDTKQRFRVIDKVNFNGKRFQLNATLTEITPKNKEPEVKDGE